MKESFPNIKLFIIDEISMFGANTLLTIHRGLYDIMSNTLQFGGIFILAVGDLLQLATVGQTAVFLKPLDQMSALYGSLWQVYFKILELSEIKRQKNDSHFAEVLNRVRIGEYTDDDIIVLKTRETDKDPDNFPQEATHIFAYNDDVHHNNNQMTDRLQSQVFQFTAHDS